MESFFFLQRRIKPIKLIKNILLYQIIRNKTALIVAVQFLPGFMVCYLAKVGKDSPITGILERRENAQFK